MTLKQYHQKRNFQKTTEPKGKIAKKSGHLYVIQKHAASHLHYDFRLELEGVLKSWAIPKGPSYDPLVKRLAMHVEDHPVEYGQFEGIIPKGSYGGGTVMLWDRGFWEPLDDHPLQAYKKGHLRFMLHGEKLKGRWDLIRFKDEKHWFLIKFKDDWAQDQASYDVTLALPLSVLSQANLEEIGSQYTKIWTDEGAKEAPVKKNTKKIKKSTSKVILPEGLLVSPFPKFISPELATLVNEPPSGSQWLHEVKFDGYRILAFKRHGEIVLKSRTNKDWTAQFPSLVKALNQLEFKSLVLDGEVVVLDHEGKSNFQLLQNAIQGERRVPFVYYLFDILYFERHDLRHLPLLERKSILKNLLQGYLGTLQYSDHVLQHGEEVLKHSCDFALEGIISKRVDSAYVSKRSKHWLKIKCIKRQEFVIGGYMPPKKNRAYFGSLLLGVFNAQGTLDYTGNVGTGFTQASLKKIHEELVKNQSSQNPFNTRPPQYSKINWVKPKLVAEVEFTEWTQGGHLRHPSFKGLRKDKKPKDIIRETPSSAEEINFEKDMTTKKPRSSFVITHPEKILYPEDKITKADLLNYYETISDYILPYLIKRPLTLVRCPDNYEHCFYQRHCNQSTPEALQAIEVKEENKMAHYIYLNDKEGLFNLVQMGVLEIHPWGSQIMAIENPDIIIFDLDPGPDVPWEDVVFAAYEIRDYLQQYHLRSFVKSTGGKGLHVVIPIKPEYDWEDVKEFTKIFVTTLERTKPDKYISKMTKSKRKGKIFVDYLRNQRTATSIAPYSTRARIHAPVSTPLAWEELSNRREDVSFTIHTLPQRLKKLKTDPWEDFWVIKQSLNLDQ